MPVFILAFATTAQQVKNPPAMQETKEIQVWSLGQEEPLEEEMATHSNILAWKIPWTEEPAGLQSMGSQGDMTEQLSSNSIINKIKGEKPIIISTDAEKA